MRPFLSLSQSESKWRSQIQIWYRHTLYCALLYWASQMLHFFTNQRQEPPTAKRLGLTLLLHSLYRGGLEMHAQYL